MTDADFNLLVSELRPQLVWIAQRRCRYDLAEDAVQKAVTRAWQAGHWRRATRETVAGWLRHAVARYAQAELRGIRRFRGLQAEVAMLVNKGWKQANAAPYMGSDEKMRLESLRKDGHQ